MTKNIGVLISGEGSNLQSIIDSIENNEIKGEIKIVISNKHSAFGLERASKHGIKGLYISKKEVGSEDAFNKRIIEELQKENVDLVILAGYLNILTPYFIKAFPNKIINIHPSLIPSFCGMGYYGIKVHEAVINYGVKITGATVHFVNEVADNGAIILQDSVKVFDDDTAETLQKRVLEVEHRLLPMAVKLFCDDKLKLETKNNRNIVKIRY